MFDNYNVHKAFQSILRADYISIDDSNQLKMLGEYYVDIFNNLPIILQDQDNYINGRRGTGKTTLLLRAYYECLKTISPKIKETSNVIGDRKILPIYIDLNQCKDIFEETDERILERVFIGKIISELKQQLNTVFEIDKLKIIKRNYSELEEFGYIEDVLKYGVEIKVKRNDEKEEIKSLTDDHTSAAVSLANPSVEANFEEKKEKLITHTVQKIEGVSAQEFLTILGEIRKKSKLNSIYIFVDEFSELASEEQARLSALLKKLLGSKNNIFFKIGTITGRYDFGENIIIGRDVFPISLDLNDFAERYGGIVGALKILEEFTYRIINNRLKTFDSKLNFDLVFQGAKKEIIFRITRESMGVPRTIGIILQNALIQAETEGENKKISIKDINVGLRYAKKMYMQQFQGAVKKKIIPGFYMDMWNSILGKALSEKERTKKEKRPASHFMIDPMRAKYLEVLCENFIVHLLEESRTSKYGGKYFLYAIDYEICRENDITYAEVKDEFTAARFIYDSVLSKFDCYFVKEAIKSYRCPKCNSIYQENEVAKMRVKRCFECDEKLEEIIHRDVPMTKGNYTEAEVKILGMIGSLNEDEAMSAVEISEAVGCSRQKVSNWCSKVLYKKGLINIIKKNGKNYYFDYEEESNYPMKNDADIIVEEI